MDSDTFTVKAAAEMLRISPETLRRWTNQFGHHLSTAARPPKGEERRFTQDDLRLLLWVREHLRDGTPWHELDRQIPVIEPGEMPSWADVTGSRQVTASEPTAIETPNRLLTVLERMADTASTAERQQAEIGQLRSELDVLRAEIAALKAAAATPPVPPQRLTFWDRLTGRKPPV